jgi:hypothetical protein
MTVAWASELASGERRRRRARRRQQRVRDLTAVGWLVALVLALALLLGFGWDHAHRLVGDTALRPGPTGLDDRGA